MAKEEKAPQEPKVKKEKKMSSDAKLDILIGAVGKLVELQQTAIEREQHPIVVEEKKIIGRSFTPHMDDETYPKDYIPPKFRKIVNEFLSEDFGARVVDFEDRTDFQFDIIVPEKYSSVTREDRAKGVEDIRTRIIPRALGENGVREWCQLIRKNLNKYYTNEGKASPFINSAE